MMSRCCRVADDQVLALVGSVYKYRRTEGSTPRPMMSGDVRDEAEVNIEAVEWVEEARKESLGRNEEEYRRSGKERDDEDDPDNFMGDQQPHPRDHSEQD
jgi:hypothetical protein